MKRILIALLLAASPSFGRAEDLRIFDVREFGAKGDGQSLDTRALQQALDAAGKAGGGIVHLKPGTYLSQPLYLRDKTRLQLDRGATLQATDEPSHFDDPRKPQSRVAFVNGKDLSQIAITGAGVIDGAGARWWKPVQEGKRLARARGETFTETVRRPRLITLSGCRDVRVEGVTIQNSPTFHLVPGECENVLITNVTFRAPAEAPNTDAMDPSACKNVRIIGCTIDVGDDNIAIKSGRKVSGREFAVENVWVERCTFLNGHGMSIGSETAGGVRNLVVTNCTFNGTTSGIRIKSARGKGGLVENLVYTDITMTNVDYPIYLTSYYPKVPATDPAQPLATNSPVYRNIVIRNVTAHSAKTAGMIVGLPELPIENVTLENVRVTAPTGLMFRNVRAIQLQATTITPAKGPPFILETNAEVTGLPRQ